MEMEQFPFLGVKSSYSKTLKKEIKLVTEKNGLAVFYIRENFVEVFTAEKNF